MMERFAREFTRADLTVLTDRPFKENHRSLRRGYPGWWSKIELFAPWNADLRPCLFLDLDTYVLDSIEDLASYGGDDFWMLADFNRPDNGASGVMLIPRDVSAIWENWEKSPQVHMGMWGDQAFLGRFKHSKLQERYEGIVSYKNGLKREPPRDGDRIVCFHGKPKPHFAEGWARDIWNEYSA